LLENESVPWHEYIVVEALLDGRMVRTKKYKYFKIRDDPVEQLFDMEDDPLETNNLFYNSKYASVIEEHRKLLCEWQSRMKIAPVPDIDWQWG
jgi:hypothetical protein